MQDGESLEQMQARHRKEQRDLQSRVTNKKKNATKKTRKFVNDECAQLERELRERQEGEVRALRGEADGLDTDGDDDDEQLPSRQPPRSEEDAPPTAATDLASKLASATLSPSQPAAKQGGGGEQKEQVKQKRNRQKERLARRAAEQEAAAAQAASEAAAMPDERALERRAMQASFAAHALREHEIAPDGHCLFSAVADQLGLNGIPLAEGGKGTGTGTDGEGAGVDMAVAQGEAGLKPKVEMPYRVVRRAAADWISGHREVYEGFLEEGVDGYVERIRDTAEWGGELELSALANAYGVEIRVVQGGGRVEVVKPEAQAAAGEEGKGEEKGKTLWLAYYRHGYGLGEHYNSLRKAGP
ncbi:hypothetical protein C8A01DRAFT_49815 [Parachaetomium inaequale]|uniref:OTU domain-containing protein n=1 Tax=Parachaetomium inaequale TaxID=2588326 RepID=A0AAN6P8D0_9PEZI|nr:hypothetical protein C8A01DRAFT_49815 [Parachaetomium inaequale]